MLSGAAQKRYARHLILPEIGEEGQLRLQQSKVLVVGAGGLGSPVLQYLAAAGVGRLGVVDDDKVDASNLQRQILFMEADAGASKAQVAAVRLAAQNAHIIIQAHDERLSNVNALQLISQYDIVVDGSDNFATRYMVNDSCVILGKPLVFGSISSFQGQVSVFNYQDGPTYRCLYPQPPAPGEVPSCAEAGVLGVVPGICGTLMANEVIKMICGIGEVLKGRLLIFDALKLSFDSFAIPANPENKNISTLCDYDVLCGVTDEITAAQVKEKIAAKAVFQLVDVREQGEYAVRNIGGMLIPLQELADNLHKLSKDTDIVVHCASGARSKRAVQLLKENGFARVYNLRNGLLDF